VDVPHNTELRHDFCDVGTNAALIERIVTTLHRIQSITGITMTRVAASEVTMVEISCYKTRWNITVNLAKPLITKLIFFQASIQFTHTA
jgi:hypothetical protein